MRQTCRRVPSTTAAGRYHPFEERLATSVTLALLRCSLIAVALDTTLVQDRSDLLSKKPFPAESGFPAKRNRTGVPAQKARGKVSRAAQVHGGKFSRILKGGTRQAGVRLTEGIRPGRNGQSHDRLGWHPSLRHLGVQGVRSRLGSAIIWKAEKPGQQLRNRRHLKGTLLVSGSVRQNFGASFDFLLSSCAKLANFKSAVRECFTSVEPRRRPGATETGDTFGPVARRMLASAERTTGMGIVVATCSALRSFASKASQRLPSGSQVRLQLNGRPVVFPRSLSPIAARR